MPIADCPQEPRDDWDIYIRSQPHTTDARRCNYPTERCASPQSYDSAISVLDGCAISFTVMPSSHSVDAMKTTYPRVVVSSAICLNVTLLYDVDYRGVVGLCSPTQNHTWNAFVTDFLCGTSLYSDRFDVHFLNPLESHRSFDL